MSQTECVSKCGTSLPLDGARPCAILICKKCRQDPEKLERARTILFHHLDQHKAQERQTNPYYPFSDLRDMLGLA